MNVLAYVHLYGPDHCAGAEMYLHEMLLGLKARGHNVQVVVDSSSADRFDGVPVSTDLGGWVDWADVVVTHLDRTIDAMEATHARKPLVHLVHNDRQLARHRVRSAELVVFNSRWIAEKNRWPGRYVVVPPPVDPQRYRVDPAGIQAITLINLSKAKGADVFWELARRMPGRLFMGVVGGYDRQVMPNRLPANVVLIPHTPDIRTVYAQTNILLMPSGYESWGRVGIEAAASGIPTIAHPTPGLQESLGYAGIFADRADVGAWERNIVRLSDHDRYEWASEQSRRRSMDLDPEPYHQMLEQELRSVITEWENR